MEDNLDAYRTIAEILHELRLIMRRQIEVAHGKEWYRTALPEGMLERLIDRKEHEKEIDWYEIEYRELIDFAGFRDLLDVLEKNPGLIPGLENLAPGQVMLHARFIELEVMREKLAMCRSISEKELTFLSTFHLRFRQALETARTRISQLPSQAGESAEPEETPEASPPEKKPKPTAKPAPKPKARTETKTDEPPPTEEGDAEPAKDAAEPEKKDDSPKRPPMRKAVSKTRPKAGGSKTTKKGSTPDDSHSDADELEEAPLDVALKENDNRTVLRALYREVTAIAEGLWTSDVPPTANVWRQVRVSPWFEAQITKLGLKPLSDFYGIIDRVDERMRDGIAKDQLQDFLKDSNFAQILLSLRDMFQQNGI